MKISYTTLLSILLIHTVHSQVIFEYEQEIIDSIKYEYEEINFENRAAKIELGGTLISPKSGYDKLVIIVPGSGKDTRHSHFVLAENFLENGIAIYRFDERGVGKSKGKYDYKATTLSNDLSACFRHLRNDDRFIGKKIGVLGHSMGGMASLDSYGKKCAYDFIILIGTPVEKNGAFIKYQAECNSDGFYSVKGKSKAAVVQFVDEMISLVVAHENEKELKKIAKRKMKEMGFKKALHLVINPLQIDLIRLNHEKILKELDKPMLYLMGSEDKIVSSDRETEILERFNNKMITIKVIDDTNHWLNTKIGPTRMEKELYRMKDEAITKIMDWTLKLD